MAAYRDAPQDEPFRPLNYDKYVDVVDQMKKEDIIEFLKSNALH